jgi:hypothetical protein
MTIFQEIILSIAIAMCALAISRTIWSVLAAVWWRPVSVEHATPAIVGRLAGLVLVPVPWAVSVSFRGLSRSAIRSNSSRRFAQCCGT